MCRAEDARGGIAQSLAIGKGPQARILLEPSGIAVLAMQALTHRARSPPGTDEPCDLHGMFTEHHLAMVDLTVVQPYGRMQVRNQMGTRNDDGSAHQVQLVNATG